MAQEVQTGVGRIVWGNPTKPMIKKYQDGPQKGQPVLKDGNPVHQWAFGVAYPKHEFQAMVWPFMQQEAMSGYPQGIPGKFAWKYVDGDTNDSNGKPFSAREGYAGCYILAISTEAFAPPVYKFVNGVYQQMSGNEVKTGDFITAKVKFVLNIPQDRTRVPSLYVNPIGILHVGYGTEILNGPDPTALFGQQPQQYQLPPGASATPLAPVTNVAMPNGMPQHNPGNISSGPMVQPQMQQPMMQPNPGMQMQQPQQPMMQPNGMPGPNR